MVWITCLPGIANTLQMPKCAMPSDRYAGHMDMNHQCLHAGRTLGRIGYMWVDVIVEEIRKVREEHAAKFNFDLEAIYRDLKDQEEQGNRWVVSLPPRES